MIAAAISAVSTTVSKVMGKLPDYDQKKKEQWNSLLLKYDSEMKKIYPERDDDAIMNLREQIILFAESFSKEIK